MSNVRYRAHWSAYISGVECWDGDRIAPTPREAALLAIRAFSHTTAHFPPEATVRLKITVERISDNHDERTSDDGDEKDDYDEITLRAKDGRGGG